MYIGRLLAARITQPPLTVIAQSQAVQRALEALCASNSGSQCDGGSGKGSNSMI
mgnify:CR=1 FL=1